MSGASRQPEVRTATVHVSTGESDARQGLQVELATGGRDGATYRYAEPPPAVLQRVQAMEAVCRRRGVDLATAAVQFPLAHPLVAAAFPGTNRLKYVTGNVQRLQTPVPADLRAELKAEGLLRPGTGINVEHR